MWDEITYPFPNFSGCWEWRSNFIVDFIGHVITHPCWDLSWSMLMKGAHVIVKRLFAKKLEFLQISNLLSDLQLGFFLWRGMGDKLALVNINSLWLLKLLATLLFVKQLTTKNIKALHYWIFMKRNYKWPVDSPHKGLVIKKKFIPWCLSCHMCTSHYSVQSIEASEVFGYLPW